MAPRLLLQNAETPTITHPAFSKRDDLSRARRFLNAGIPRHSITRKPRGSHVRPGYGPDDALAAYPGDIFTISSVNRGQTTHRSSAQRGRQPLRHRWRCGGSPQVCGIIAQRGNDGCGHPAPAVLAADKSPRYSMTAKPDESVAARALSA